MPCCVALLQGARGGRACGDGGMARAPHGSLQAGLAFPQCCPVAPHAPTARSFMRFMERYAQDKGLGFQKSS